MKFEKYQHVERFGNLEVNGIDHGLCYIFYKIDGTNASIWLGDDGDIKAGSRNRELTLEKDNAGFYKWALEQKNIDLFFQSNPGLRLYGEWLVPHSLKTYRDEAWRNFYVFDVLNDKGEYISYDKYSSLLDFYKINYIPPICKIENPTEETLYKQLSKTGDFLVEDGKGIGEGIVIKNYGFINRSGRTVWAKIVSGEFKEKHSKTMGAPLLKQKECLEKKIIDKMLSKHFIDKEYEKIKNDTGWSSKDIPRLLNTVFYEFIRDEMWNILKEFKNPLIDFKALKNEITKKIRELKKELF